MTDEVRIFTVEGTGKRLDITLAAQLSEFSRSRLQGLIRDGFVTVDGVTIVKSGSPVNPGQKISIRIPPPAPSELQPENISLDIVFENEDLLIVNKPAGMVVHPSAGHDSGTLVHAALGYVPDLEGVGGTQRPGIVHRLDKDTSGLIVIAKNDRTHHWLQEQFRTRQVEKVYLALVDGKPPTRTGRIEAPIGRDPAHRKQMAIVPEGKGRAAITEYKTLESFSKHALLEVHPYTGRTHQIRLHLKMLGTPIVGDTLYGHRHPSLPVQRQFLHAASLTIRVAAGEAPRHFQASLPEDLQKALEEVRQNEPHSS